MNVYLIAAVGKRGQLGLNGEMPWHDPEDLRFFRAMTLGRRVVFGMATLIRLPDLPGREVIADNPLVSPVEFLARHGDVDQIWIGGGAKTYARYLPFVRRSFVTHVDYDGPADVWMPQPWGQTAA